MDATVAADQDAVATGSLASDASTASSSSSQPSDGPGTASDIDPYTAGQDSSPYTPSDGSAPFTPDGSDPAADPYTGGQSIDPYTGGQTADPYTGDQSVDPYSASTGQDIGALDYTPADDGNAADADGQTSADDEILAAGVMLPSGNYGFADSVANWLRTQAGKTFGDELVESIESGNPSPQVAEFIDRYGLDTAVDLANGYADTGKFVTLEEQAEGLKSVWNVAHNQALVNAPQDGTEASNLSLQSEIDHFAGDHAGDFANNPAEFSNPNYNVDAVAEETLGEGNLNIVSDTADLGMGGEGVPSSAIDWFGDGEGFAGEAVEGSEVIEGAGTALEVGEGLEAADALWLLLFL